MALMSNDGEFDPRNHRSFLIPGYELESLADVPEEKVAVLNSLIGEAEELEFPIQARACQRWIALHTSVDGKRARLTADVAKHDEAMRSVESENQGGGTSAPADAGAPM